MFGHVLVAGIAACNIHVLFLFLSDGIGRVLFGQEAAVREGCTIAWLQWPSFQHWHSFPIWRAGLILTASLARLRLAFCFAPLLPLIRLLMARGIIEVVLTVRNGRALRSTSSRRRPHESPGPLLS